MQIEFLALDEPLPGERWQSLFQRTWPAYRSWFLREGDAARPSYGACLRALRGHMPELVPLYERLVDLAGGGDPEARFLSLYRPTPYLSGCSQAVWVRERPLLIRNYDYSPNLWEGMLLRSAWNGSPVVAMSDCLWGALDGINAHGLAVSLAFGGRKVVGDGFGIPLVLRYVLEFCETTRQAVELLLRIPVHMAYNVTLLDASGAYCTALLAPDRDPAVLRRALATNHQHGIEWHEHALATGSIDREQLLERHLEDPAESVERFAERFLEPPLYAAAHGRGWGTLYTAVYDPIAAAVSVRWPGYAMEQGCRSFSERALVLTYPSAEAAPELVRAGPADAH
jgi:predicted choloylglycine hydrolase